MRPSPTCSAPAFSACCSPSVGAPTKWTSIPPTRSGSRWPKETCDRLDLWRIGGASLVHGVARRSRRARSLAQRYVRPDLLVADARRQGDACRGRLPPERTLEIRELLRALRLGPARRHGRHWQRRAAPRAGRFFSPARGGEY